jgi:hypothetical protein
MAWLSKINRGTVQRGPLGLHYGLSEPLERDSPDTSLQQAERLIDEAIAKNDNDPFVHYGALYRNARTITMTHRRLAGGENAALLNLDLFGATVAGIRPFAVHLPSDRAALRLRSLDLDRTRNIHPLWQPEAVVAILVRQ